MKFSHNGKTCKIRPRFLEKCDWYLRSKDVKRLVPISFNANGYSAVECFFAVETLSVDLPSREPEKLAMLLNGKMWHGVTVETAAAMLLECLTTRREIFQDYPAWVADEIIAQAKKRAEKVFGYVPTFIIADPPTH